MITPFYRTISSAKDLERKGVFESYISYLHMMTMSVSDGVDDIAGDR